MAAFIKEASMRLPRHVVGFIVFIMILTCVEMINDFFSRPFGRAVRVKVAAPAPAVPPAAADEAPPVNYDVRLVSLDFINGKSYTTLVLKLRPGQPAPEKLLVTTRFYVPGGAENQSWSSPVGITRPSATGDRVEVTVTSACYWCDRPDTPRAGYFANVYVTAQYEGKDFPLEPGPLVGATIPVMVQAERKAKR
jgi:hypothetical protein